MKSLIFLAALLSIALTEERVAIQLSSRQIMIGNSIRVTCKVPRNAENRFITGMVDWVSYDTKPLEGEHSAVTWEFWFHKMPCDATTGACELQTSDRKTIRTQLSFNVAGCGEDPQ